MKQWIWAENSLQCYCRNFFVIYFDSELHFNYDLIQHSYTIDGNDVSLISRAFRMENLHCSAKMANRLSICLAIWGHSTMPSKEEHASHVKSSIIPLDISWSTKPNVDWVSRLRFNHVEEVSWYNMDASSHVWRDFQEHHVNAHARTRTHTHARTHTHTHTHTRACFRNL